MREAIKQIKEDLISSGFSVFKDRMYLIVGDYEFVVEFNKNVWLTIYDISHDTDELTCEVTSFKRIKCLIYGITGEKL